MSSTSNGWFCFSNCLFSFIGAFILYYRMIDSGKPVLSILFYLNPELQKKPWSKFIESIIVSAIGGLISIALTQPSSIPQAIVAGLGWTGLVNGAGKRED